MARRRVVANPRIVAALCPTVEPIDRLVTVVEQDDLAKTRAVLARERLQPGDLLNRRVVLRQNHVTPAIQVGRGHDPDQRRHDRPRIRIFVLPPADQVVQSIDIEMQRAGIPVRVQPRQCRFADAGRAVQVDEAGHSAMASSALRP